MSENASEEINPTVSKADYILAIVPLIMFAYPIAAIGLGIHQPDFYFREIHHDWDITMKKLIEWLSVGGLLLFSIIGWYAKSKQGKQRRVVLPYGMIVVDLFLFVAVLQLFGSITPYEGWVAKWWDICVGLLFVVIIKISFGIHGVDETWDATLKRFQDLW